MTQSAKSNRSPRWYQVLSTQSCARPSRPSGGSWRTQPSQAYIERITDTIEKNEWRPEQLTEVTDYNVQDLKDFVPKLGKDGKYVAFRARPSVPAPTDSEGLRRRITLLGTAWCMVALAQPTLPQLVGLTPQLF